jgi:hypothetical protein
MNDERRTMNEVELAGRSMLTDRYAARCLGATNRTIVPFVSHFREIEPVSVCSSRLDEIRSRVEAVLELILVVAGVAGVIAVLS